MLICWITLIVFQFSHTINGTLQFDDAFNGAVAKNLVYGPGYATTYDSPVFFNPGLTTGPTVTIPASVLIVIFGNKHWVPSLSIVIEINILLSVLFLWRSWAPIKIRALAITGLIFFLMLLNIKSSLFVLIGEVPSILFTIISFILISQHSKNKRYLFWAGVFSGLAALTKLTSLLVLPTLLFFLFLHYKKGNFREILKSSLKAILGFAFIWIPYLLSLYVTYFLTETNIIKGETILKFLSQPGSGFEWVITDKNNILRNIIFAVKSFLSLFGNALAAIVLALIFISIAVLVWKKFIATFKSNRQDFYLNLSFCLTILGSMHLAWWIFISGQGWLRHIYPGLMFFFFALVIYFITHLTKIARIYFVFLITIFIFSSNVISRSAYLNFSNAFSDRQVALEAAIDKVIELKKENPNIILAGCSWWSNPDLEYLLPTYLNFRDCNNLSIDEIKNTPVYLVRSEFYFLPADSKEIEFTNQCDKNIVFFRAPFTISRCN